MKNGSNQAVEPKLYREFRKKHILCITRKKLVATAKHSEGACNRTVEPSGTFFEKGGARKWADVFLGKEKWSKANFAPTWQGYKDSNLGHLVLETMSYKKDCPNCSHCWAVCITRSSKPYAFWCFIDAIKNSLQIWCPTAKKRRS